MRNLITTADQKHCVDAGVRCPCCDSPLLVKNRQTGDRLSAPAAHALIDHLSSISTELAEVRRLVEEAVL